MRDSELWSHSIVRQEFLGIGYPGYLFREPNYNEFLEEIVLSLPDSETMVTE